MPETNPATTEAGRVTTVRLQRLARAYAESAVFFSAIDLELFTHVARGAGTVAELADAMGTSALNAERLTDVCLAMDLIRLDSEGRFINAPDTQRYLIKDEPRYAGPWMQFTRPGVRKWFDLTDLLTSQEPPTLLGMYDGLTVERARRYHRATYSVGMGAGRRFTRHVDLSGRRMLLDLGGGSGAYSINAVQAFDGLQAIVLDLPPVTVVTQEFIDQNEVGDRVSTLGGDFTSTPFPGCDAVVMASNLPIYDEVVIGQVVQKAFDALDPGGEMHLVGEMLAEDGVGPLDASLWGMEELLTGGAGKSHSVTEVRGYFTDAGFAAVADDPFIEGTLVRVSGTKPRP